SIGVLPAVFPMPVLMIGTYDEEGKVDVMNAAWGCICDPDKILLCLTETHKTVQNLRKTRAFTVAPATRATAKESDFFGTASANNMPDKFARSGFTAEKAEKVNAPVIQEYPLCVECELLEEVKTESLHAIVGKIVNVTCEEACLNEKGKVDVTKLDAIAFDQFGANYFTFGEKLGGAWQIGREFMK
ncbi:MAG: flavin reductase family protein, partial [bacterium]